MVISCSVAALSCDSFLDLGVLVLFGALLVLVIVGLIISSCTARFVWTVARPIGGCCGAFNIANIVCLAALIGGLIAYPVVVVLVAPTQENPVNTLGLTAGVAGSLPLWWAFFRGGVHRFFNMTVEASLRIHSMLGLLTLLAGTVHGVYAICRVVVPDNEYLNPWYILGLLGMLILYLAVVPVPLQWKGVLSYDRWKRWHYLSLLGYAVTLAHIIGHTIRRKNIGVVAVAIIHGLALILFIVQKVYSKRRTCTATLESAILLSEDCGQHVFFRLTSPGFRAAPGQWGHLLVPSVSPVPHPFTLVPGDPSGEDADSVQIFMKVVGKFTTAVLEQLQGASPPAMRLEGPYGSPLQLQLADAAVFILGGVGVTPALSVVAEAQQRYGPGRVYVYWTLRSPGLLQRCVPFLQQNWDHKRNFVYVNVEPEGASAKLPLGAVARGKPRKEVADWLPEVVTGLGLARATAPLLFVSAPAPLTKAALREARQASSTNWLIHVEQFWLLPGPPCGSCCGRRHVEVAPPHAPVHSQARKIY